MGGKENSVFVMGFTYYRSSWEAADGIVDPEVLVTSSESNLFYNIVKEEKMLSKPTPSKSVTQRMSEASTEMSSDSHNTNTSSAAPSDTAPASTTSAPATKTSQSV